MSEIVNVGIAELKIVQAPKCLRSSGLGSCVGVIIYDPIKKIAGLAHVMLPDSTITDNKNSKAGKYADIAPREIYHQLVKLGAKPTNLKAKIAGGAQMFDLTINNPSMGIGNRNVAAIRKELEQLGIVIVSEDVGGKSGRTIEFNTETSELTIKTVFKGTTII